MQWLLVIVLSLHVLAAVFWAGSTFAVARSQGAGAETLFRPQMGAATIAIICGGYLWHVLHEGSFGLTEKILGVAALSGLLALIFQAAIAGPALGALRRQEADIASARKRIAVAYRAASALLAVAVIGMAAARYA